MAVDGTELCELVGFYLLDLLAKKFDEQNISLYRDDGLSCFENICPDSQKIKKKKIKIFKSNGLSIKVEFGLMQRNAMTLGTDTFF